MGPDLSRKVIVKHSKAISSELILSQLIHCLGIQIFLCFTSNVSAHGVLQPLVVRTINEVTTIDPIASIFHFPSYRPLECK